MFVAIRDFTVKWLGYSDLFKGLDDLGVDSFELFVSRDLRESAYQDMDYTTSLSFDFSGEEKIQAVAQNLKAGNVNPCAVLVENDFGKADLSAEKKWVVDACSVAAGLGVKTVRINSVMRPQEGVSEAQYAEITASVIAAILRQTGHLDVSLALENHGVVGNRREFIRGLFSDVGSDRLGLTLDTGNFYWFGYPLDEVYEIIEEFASSVKHCHLKNVSFAPYDRQKAREPGWRWPDSVATIYEGDIDHRRVVGILESASYDGDLTIEDESLGKFRKEEHVGVIKRDIEYVTSLL